MSRNKLMPRGSLGWLGNFIVNFFWAIVWLGRSIIRIVRKHLGT